MVDAQTDNAGEMTLEELQKALLGIADEKGCYGGLTLIVRMSKDGSCVVELIGVDIRKKMMELGNTSGSLPEALQQVLSLNGKEV